MCVPKSGSKRAHFILPVDVVADIDKLVGRRGRSAFLTEVARDEIMRRQQRDALRKSAGAWKDEDHPELKAGSAAWVGKMRAESDGRFDQIQQHRAGVLLVVIDQHPEAAEDALRKAS